MARYYQTGVTASVTSLHNIITYFAVNTLGWTLLHSNPGEKVGNSSADASARKTSYFSFNGGKYYLTNNPTEGNDNYLAGGVLEGVSPTDTGGSPYSYTDQTGYVFAGLTDELYGPFTKYHLFGGQEGVDGNYLYVVVETTAGIFCHFGMGDLNRIGNTTGRFCVGLSWNMGTNEWRNPTSNYHQRMFDSSASYNSGRRGHLSYHQLTAAPAGECYYFGDNDITYAVYGGSVGGMNGEFLGNSPNAMNGRAMLMPNHIRLRDPEDAWYRIVGVAPAFRTVNIKELQAEDIVDTDWMVFPVKAKNTTSGPNSGNYGWAYKFQGA